ncbi:flavin-containing monooxygenase [Algiphilus aromaticivorans]|uniref:flavin-containing monooxygenase n=1 Tax=Algiphilus aromaticivorans TaxID=382454 RepID=UPI0005C18CB6|nr:NAD(P)/FAD-dependent oxidoreductase [Algiphilus aromaticivorans]
MTHEELDVLIVGAGLSGIGAGYHLQQRCPDKSWAILEARDAIGGTWDLFRYPGIRSDSDMFTLGYAFRPWQDGKTIADGESIRQYVRDTAERYGITQKIRFNHRVLSASWDSESARWTVETESNGETKQIRCRFFYLCSGYYDYDEGYTPHFEGRDDFAGDIIHPQHWPEDLDYSGKRVVVIGSGATAVTLVPSMAEKAGHVTMLQRSPSYVLSLPDEDHTAETLSRFIPRKAAFGAARWKHVMLSMAFFQFCRRFPERARKMLRKQVAAQLPEHIDVDTHFRPSYNPWDQRLCFVPNGDLFKALRAGTASIATDHIERFVPEGIRLQSGETLEADIIVTATGLKMLAMGGIEFSVDGEAVQLPEQLSYKGMMISELPNMAIALGYTNASWTLKADLTSMYVCRLLQHMDKHGYDYCMPRNQDPTLEEEPIIDLAAGYVLRALDQFPKQGSRAPWKLYQNYVLDLLTLRWGRVRDEAMHFGHRRAPAAARRRAAA